jgi:hypothetical protein
MPKYAYLIPFLNLIPFFAGFNILFNFKNVKAKLFGAYLIVTAICGLICFYIAMINGNNHWCYNLYQIIVFILLALIFDIEFQKKVFFKISVLMSIFLIYNTYATGLFIFNQINFNIIFTCIGILSGVCIKKVVFNTAEPEFKEFDFWMYGGFFIFSFGSLFLNLFLTIVTHKTNYSILHFYAIYQIVLNVIVNLIFFKVVRLLKKNEH